MKLQDIVNLDNQYYMNTFGARTPVCFEYGKGINLWDTEGNKYYDFLGGIAVNALGHSHPALVNAVKEQAEKLIHCSSLYYIENQALLAEMLVKNSCADRVFFGNSGAEANEGAIKLARIYFKKKGLENKYEIISLHKSFHGRTLTTIAATGQEKYQKPFTPLTPGFMKATLNDIKELEKAIMPETCAIMLEPIQGESGVNPADIAYMKAVRELCDKHDMLLILDEIQTGLGRTGKLFAYEHYGIEPDIFTLAKALGGGVPIGALCAKEHVAKAFDPGDHGSTFGGNPLACAAGLAVMSTLIKDSLVDNSKNMGDYFKSKLEELKARYGVIAEIRGAGLMLGIQFNKDIAVELKNKLFELKYLVGSVGSNVLRLLPPLIIMQNDIDQFIAALDNSLSSL